MATTIRNKEEYFYIKKQRKVCGDAGTMEFHQKGAY